MKNGIKVIDCEHHFILDSMIEEWRKTMTSEQWEAGGGVTRYDNPTDELKKALDVMRDIDVLRLEEMDRDGIDFAQISLTTPGAEYFEPETGKKIATVYNDTLMAAIKKHPDRLGAYMALYPDDVEWSLKEIDRCAEGHNGT